MTQAMQQRGPRRVRFIPGASALAALPLLFVLSACGDDAAPPKVVREEEHAKPWTSLVDGEKVLERVKRICALGPREPGTKGSEAARTEIEKQMREAGYAWSQLKRQTFTQKTPDPKQTPTDANNDPEAWPNETKFVNLIAVLPGKKKEGIAFAAHYDTKIFDFPFVGANDAASAVAGVIELAAVLMEESKTKPRENSIYFIFFDGEESIRQTWADPDNRYGSRYFVSQMDEKKDAFEFPLTGLVLLDMIAADKLRLADEKNSDSHLRKIFKDKAKEIFGYRPFEVPAGGAITDDHVSFKGTKVLTIDLIDVHFDSRTHAERPWWHTEHDTVDLLTAESINMVLTLCLASLKDVEAFCNQQ